VDLELQPIEILGKALTLPAPDDIQRQIHCSPVKIAARIPLQIWRKP
jgi:hypothetical protein